MMTWAQMIGVAEMERSELTNILVVVFAGFGNGLDER